jgi:NAD(P)-dependent dehydrogenase (short-subunit alcohol dehydrogenase family)
MGRVDGKVAFVTGTARGQGRAHAVRLAREGADVVALDVCRQLPHIAIPMATPEDLRTTAEQVERAGRRVLAIKADVRDQQELTAAVGRAYHEFGTIDIVIANAGVTTYTIANDIEEGEFEQILNVNLMGV